METTLLTGVPETMLITLWAKATETQQNGGLIEDNDAVRMMKQIDYDFSKFKKAKMSQAGSCVRASLIDKETREFIKNNPDAVVIQLGAGIDARYQRIGAPKVEHWYDLDLPEAIEVRRKLLPESERNTYIAQSLFDYSWCDTVKAHGKPILVIIEGVMMYFEPEKVREFFCEICNRLGKATVLMDILFYSGVKHARQHDAMKKMDNDVEFKWSVLHSVEMESWHERLHLGREYFMSDYDQGRLPLVFRLLCKIPYLHTRFNQRIVRFEIN